MLRWRQIFIFKGIPGELTLKNRRNGELAMAAYVNERCVRCRHSLTGGFVPDYYQIGKPIEKCAKCGALNSRASKSNEWELLSRWRQAKHWMLATVWGWCYSLLLGIMVIPFFASKMNPERVGETFAEGAWWMYPSALAISLSVSYYRLFNRIRQSKERMADTGYRAELRQAGIMP